MNEPWTIRSLGAALRDGSVTSEAVVTAMFKAADTLDGELGVYLARFDDTALAAARRADAELSAGQDRGPLHGVPVGVKDILSTDEGPTTCQSKVLPPSWGDRGDGPVVRRLRDAGAVVMGKLTTMEFAVGRPARDMAFPLPRNPWDTDRWTGGSSSGSGGGRGLRADARRSAPTPGAASGCPPPTAASPVTSRPTAWCPRAAASPSATPSTTSARCAVRRGTVRRCSA